jgi:hypothetical protein
MNQRRLFERRYAECMTDMWDNPCNDQRLRCQQWLRELGFQGHRILDVGGGDAYYLEDLRPSTYTLVEPNALLRRRALDRAKDIGVPAEAYPSVARLLAAEQKLNTDAVLLVHVLLYLSRDEAGALLPLVRDKPLAVVHPEVNSVTIEVEDALGLRTSRDLIKIKQDVLGLPSSRAVIHTHLHLSPSATLEDIVFLVGHLVLRGRVEQRTREELRRFVEARLRAWRSADGYRLPQPQCMESYNLHC